MKKRLTTILTVGLVTMSMATTVFAGGHHNGGHRNNKSNYVKTTTNTSYSVCGQEDCYETAVHSHNGVSYKGHYNNDGHGYHQLCTVEGCTESSFHSHDGVGCYGHYDGDGHGHNNQSGRGCHN